MSLYENIRGALQTQAAMAVGFPPADQRSYQGVVFDSTVGVPWARMTLHPTQGRAFSVSAVRKFHAGLFQVDLVYPAGLGTSAVEAAADAVKDVFAPGTIIEVGGERILIDYAERGPSNEAPDWIQIPITVSWRCYSTNN